MKNTIHRFIEGAGLAVLGALGGYIGAHAADLPIDPTLSSLIGAIAAAVATWAKQEQQSSQ